MAWLRRPGSIDNSSIINEINYFHSQPQSSIAPVQIFYNLLHFSLKLLSKLVIGQFIISVFDFFVLRLQKILEFCVPQDSKDVDGSTQVAQKNVRPIGWLIFIPFLIVLRTLRFWLSVVGVIIGRGEVTAKEMVRIFWRALSWCNF